MIDRGVGFLLTTPMDEGQKIARELIAKEAKEKTGFLDLGMLGLTELPEELYDLAHLKSLNLGRFYYDSEGKHQKTSNNLGKNGSDTLLSKLYRLKALQTLNCGRTQISDLTPRR